MGMASACGFILVLVAVFEWFEPRQRGLMICLAQLMGALGPILSAGPVKYIADIYSINWRFVFVIIGVLGVFFSILCVHYVSTPPVTRDQQKTSELEHKKMSKLLACLVLFKQYRPWAISLYCATIYLSIEYFTQNECQSFIALKGYNTQFASWLISLAWTGYAIGCPLLGYISGQVKDRTQLLYIAALITTASLLCITYSSMPSLLIIGFFFLGIGASAQNIGYVLIGEYFGPNLATIGFGLTNIVFAILAALTAPLVAFLVTPTPTIVSYQQSFWVLILAGVCACFFARMCRIKKL